MLKIFEKTENEIQEEREFNQYCNNETKRKDICPAYVFTQDRTKVDVTDLEECQIIRLYRQAFKEYILAKSNNEIDKRGRIESINDAFKLTDSLKGRRNVSYEGLKKFLEFLTPEFLKEYDMPMMGFSLSQKDKEIYNSLAKQILSPLIKDKMSKVDLIARYINESKGNFEEITFEKRIEVIDQLILNEQSRMAYKTDVQEFS